jgi:hypothetical protein
MITQNKLDREEVINALKQFPEMLEYDRENDTGLSDAESRSLQATISSAISLLTQQREDEKAWQPIETCPQMVSVLTIHQDDLFPVTAFQTGGIWLREIEGPEDVPANGKHEELRRPPTHWMFLPPGPVPSMASTSTTEEESA